MLERFASERNGFTALNAALGEIAVIKQEAEQKANARKTTNRRNQGAGK